MMKNLKLIGAKQNKNTQACVSVMDNINVTNLKKRKQNRRRAKLNKINHTNTSENIEKLFMGLHWIKKSGNITQNSRIDGLRKLDRVKKEILP